VNDGTNEGIRARTRPFYGVQFHPEACPGPEDAAFLFDDFMRLVGAIATG
jgi:carbamoyl-phosphate synthase small subunit